MLIVSATQEAPVGGWLESRVQDHPRQQQGSLTASHIWTGFTVYDFPATNSASVLTFLKREGGMRKVTVMWFVYVSDLWCEDALWTWRSCAWLSSLWKRPADPPISTRHAATHGQRSRWCCVGGSPACQSLRVAECWLCLPNPFSSTSDIQKLWITFQAHSTILVSCFRKNLLFKNCFLFCL